VWDLRTRAVTHRLGSHADSAAWAPAGDLVAVAERYTHTVQLWCTRQQQVVARLKLHTDWTLACAWSPDARYLATGSDDAEVRVWAPVK